jgi:hypothetical protein
MNSQTLGAFVAVKEHGAKMLMFTLVATIHRTNPVTIPIGAKNPVRLRNAIVIMERAESG